jgi:hypothetical protein
MSDLDAAFSRLEDLVKGARRELAGGANANAVRLIEAAFVAAQRVRRLIFIEMDRLEVAIGNPKAANDGSANPGVPPEKGD